MKKENKLIILDIRGEDEVDNNKILEKVLIRIPFKELSGRIEEILEYRENEFLILGVSGTKAYKAALMLSDYGFKKLLVVQGGNNNVEL